jgi:hypothetical protein
MVYGLWFMVLKIDVSKILAFSYWLLDFGPSLFALRPMLLASSSQIYNFFPYHGVSRILGSRRE